MEATTVAVSCGCMTVPVATGETGETVSIGTVVVVSRSCVTVAVATGETGETVSGGGEMVDDLSGRTIVGDLIREVSDCKLDNVFAGSTDVIVSILCVGLIVAVVLL